jgi:hypothetical protein
MAWAAVIETDPVRKAMLSASATAAVRWLLRHAVPGMTGELLIEPSASRPGSRPGKLGAVALTLLAIARGVSTSTNVVEGLAATIYGRQGSDGSFRCFADSIDAASDGTAQNYFPGEAMLALANLDAPGRHAVRRSFEY